ncbi:MAG TPA: MFS transporter [Nocardioidaceae bacterium]|nr:MFS transporter [Nocardioidaceae bacterium]
MRTTFRALAIRNYRMFATGGLVSNVGTWMQRVAQDWLILVITGGNAVALGITTGLQFLPMLLITPYAGVIADRFAKRKVLLVTQTAMGVTAVLLGLLAVTGLVQVWHVYVLAFVFGAGTAFDAPVRNAFVHDMVGRDNVANAVGLNSASFNLARVLGPAAAGLLIGALGGEAYATGWVILLNGLSYAAVVWMLLRMRVDELARAEAVARTKGMIREGFRYCRARPEIMLVLTVVFVAGTFGFNFQMTMAIMATEVYDRGATEYGLLGSIMAVGSLVGALIAARRTVVRQRLVVGAAIAFGITEAITGLMPTYVTFAVMLPLCGVTALTTMTAANAFVQMSVDPYIRGRVMALYMAVFMGGKPVGAPLLGWVAEVFGGRWPLIGGGAITLVGTLLATLLFARRKGLVLRATMRPRPKVEMLAREEHLARRAPA